jgi:hypothetical protein
LCHPWFYLYLAVKQGVLSFGVVAYSTILRGLAPVSLILFFIWRNKESIHWIGWSLRNGAKEIVLAIGLGRAFRAS